MAEVQKTFEKLESEFKIAFEQKREKMYRRCVCRGHCEDCDIDGKKCSRLKYFTQKLSPNADFPDGFPQFVDYYDEMGGIPIHMFLGISRENLREVIQMRVESLLYEDEDSNKNDFFFEACGKKIQISPDSVWGIVKKHFFI